MKTFATALSILLGATGLAQAQTTTPDIVVLEMVGGSTSHCANGYTFVRNSAAGKPLGTFNIPSGDSLLLTDVDWQYVAPNGAAAAGAVQILRLFAVSNANPEYSTILLESSITLSSAGQGGTTTHTLTPAPVDSGTSLCVDVFPGPFADGGGVQSVHVRGTLQIGRQP